MQQVAGFEREFACDLDDGDTAVDGIHVDDADGAGSGGHPIYEFFVGSSDEDGGMGGASVIGGDDETADLTLGHAIDLFENHLHFWDRGSTHHESDGLAVRPTIGLGFADLDQFGDGKSAYCIGFVGHQGDVSRGGQRGADEYEYGNRQKALAKHSLSPASDTKLRMIVLEEGAFIKGN